MKKVDNYDDIVKSISEVKWDENNSLNVQSFQQYSAEIHNFVIDDDEKVLEDLSLQIHEISMHISDLEVYILLYFIYVIEIIKSIE